MKAVIIAAGSGSRIRDSRKETHKSLIEINGKAVISDILDKLYSNSISDIIIITGYEHRLLEKSIRQLADKKFNIQFIYNPDWQRPNGISALCAKPALEAGEEFLLLMSDHIFENSLLQKVLAQRQEEDEALLALDFKINQIPDEDDATKIQCHKIKNTIHQITKFGKELPDFQAVDCGLFKYNYSFIETLQNTIEQGQYSLSDANNLLVKSGKFMGIDIGEAVWLDIDTPAMLEFRELINRIMKD